MSGVKKEVSLSGLVAENKGSVTLDSYFMMPNWMTKRLTSPSDELKSVMGVQGPSTP